LHSDAKLMVLFPFDVPINFCRTHIYNSSITAIYRGLKTGIYSDTLALVFRLFGMCVKLKLGTWPATTPAGRPAVGLYTYVNLSVRVFLLFIFWVMKENGRNRMKNERTDLIWISWHNEEKPSESEAKWWGGVGEKWCNSFSILGRGWCSFSLSEMIYESFDLTQTPWNTTV
jgi:hypothetical protein